MLRMSMRGSGRANCAAAISFVLAAAGAAQAGFPPSPVNVIALSGDPLPLVGAGMTVNIAPTSAPCINNDGQVAFVAVMSGPGVDFTNDRAFFVAEAGALFPVLRTGAAAPGAAPDVLVSSVGTPYTLADNGLTLFRGLLKGPSIGGGNDVAVFGGPIASTTLIAQTRTPLPDGSWTWYGLERPMGINSSGYLLLTDGDGTTSGSSSLGYWAGPLAALSAVARLNREAPDFPVPNHYDFLNWMPVLSETNRLAYSANVEVPQSLGQSGGVFVGEPGNLKALVRMGEPVPGMPGTVVESVSSPVMSPDGSAVGFSMWFNTGSERYLSVWAETPGGIRPVYINDEAVPGSPPDTRAGLLRCVAINRDNTMLLKARWGSTGSPSKYTLFTEKNETLHHMLTDRIELPELPAGVVVRFNDNYFPFNAQEQTVINALLEGPGVSSSNNRALLAWDGAGGLSVIARLGDLFEVRPGDQRLVTDIDFGWGTNGGTHRVLNESGTLVFGLNFQGGSSGVFTYTIPQTGCLADLTADGEIDFSDYLEFLNLYETQDPRVDFNEDGLVDFADYLEFLNLYEVEC